MSYLNAEQWRPRHSFSEELPPAGAYQGRHASTGRLGLMPSSWLLELTDEEDQCVRVLIAGDGSDWDEGEDEQ